MSNSNDITRSQGKKLNTNKSKTTLEENNERMYKSTEENTSGTFAPAAVILDI